MREAGGDVDPVVRAERRRVEPERAAERLVGDRQERPEGCVGAGGQPVELAGPGQ